jgi:DNA-binding transcriptional LysR family regulator
MGTAAASSEMGVFVRVAELGSFSAAARDLSLTASGVSRILGRLERRLGVRLLHRTTRKVALTSEGSVFFADCRQILSRIEEAESQVARQLADPTGLLRVQCGAAFGEQLLVPQLPEFLKRYPGIRIELALTDRIVDLVHESADIAIRIGGDPPASVVARKICDLERIICASPAYLRRRGEPRDPLELSHHDCLVLSGTPQLRRWPFKTAHGPVMVEAGGSFSANNAKSLLDMALRGVGIVRLVDAIVEQPIRDGRLVQLFADTHQIEPVPLLALYLQSRRRLPKVAAMLDYLAEKFAGAPWRARTKRRRGARR